MRSSEIENACMVVRTPVARAAPAIEAAPGTVEHAARGPGVLEQRLLLTGRFFRGVQGPSRPRKNLPEARRARMSTCEARSGTAARVDLSVIISIVKIRCGTPAAKLVKIYSRLRQFRMGITVSQLYCSLNAVGIN